jgi:hypothetical protein
MQFTTKQTAANNPFLAKVKRAMNKPTFKQTSYLMNTEGMATARVYVQQFFRGPLDPALDNLCAIADRHATA